MHFPGSFSCSEYLFGKAKLINSQKDLLIVGPLPPPIGGSPLTLMTMLEELRNYPNIRVKVVNTSPLRNVRKKMTGFTFEKVSRMFSILSKYQKEIRGCDAVLVFANDLFAFVLVPILLWLAHLNSKPFFMKPVGSGLDLFMESHGKFIKSIMLKVLRSMDGVLSQTQYLAEWLKKEGCRNSFYLPGCRPYHPVQSSHRQSDTEFRLIFMGHITRLKGPLFLLEALQALEKSNMIRVSCDFYGPIHDDVRKDFEAALIATPSAHYQGSSEAGKATEIIAGYDALVLPTCYDTEGHPGVLIEAMHAGVPVISTQIRTLPELVEHGVNGLLVPVGNSHALGDAIMQLAADCELRRKMGEANFQRGNEFRSDAVVSKMLGYIFPR